MDEPQRIGDKLRSARLAKGVSIEEAAAATRIRRSTLQALESGDFNALPAPVYTRGFLVNYARYLELNSDAVIEEFDAQDQDQEGPDPEISTPQDEQVRQPSLFSSKLLWSVVLLIAAVVILNFVWQEFLSAGPPQAEPVPEATPTSEPTPLVELPPIQSPTPIPTPSPAPTPTATPFVGVNLTLRATTQRVWLQVDSDGSIVYLGTIGPETDQGTEPLTWSADESISIIFGRTGGVEISVNGLELEPLIEINGPLVFVVAENEDGELVYTANDTPLPPPESE
jgi:cytoskeletal protein RodZ